MDTDAGFIFLAQPAWAVDAHGAMKDVGEHLARLDNGVSGFIQPGGDSEPAVLISSNHVAALRAFKPEAAHRKAIGESGMVAVGADFHLHGSFRKNGWTNADYPKERPQAT
ncbi:MAG: hypothetical protein ABI907_05680 [Ramlibacter sp.]